MKGTTWAWGSVALVSAAQLLMKWGMAQLPPMSVALLMEGFIAHVQQEILLSIVAGIVLYVLSMLCWLKVLGALPLSRAYPLLSLSYVLVGVSTALLPWFDELLTLPKIMGIALVLVGVWLINTEKENKPSSAA